MDIKTIVSEEILEEGCDNPLYGTAYVSEATDETLVDFLIRSYENGNTISLVVTEGVYNYSIFNTSLYKQVINNETLEFYDVQYINDIRGLNEKKLQKILTSSYEELVNIKNKHSK